MNGKLLRLQLVFLAALILAIHVPRVHAAAINYSFTICVAPENQTIIESYHGYIVNQTYTRESFLETLTGYLRSQGVTCKSINVSGDMVHNVTVSFVGCSAAFQSQGNGTLIVNFSSIALILNPKANNAFPSNSTVYLVLEICPGSNYVLSRLLILNCTEMSQGMYGCPPKSWISLKDSKRYVIKLPIKGHYYEIYALELRFAPTASGQEVAAARGNASYVNPNSVLPSSQGTSGLRTWAARAVAAGLLVSLLAYAYKRWKKY